MLRVRAVAMEWSRSLPLLDMVGIDGSLLAIANRAGNIDFWTCGPDRQFARVADVCLQKPWAADVTWTQWKVVNETDCE
jgi:general transcription factor 3C protein 4